MSDDLTKRINELTKKSGRRKAVQQVTDSPPPAKKKDKKYLKSFTTPGMAQAQVMARVGKVQNDTESLGTIVDNLLDRVKNGTEQDIEMVLQSQIAMLGTISAHFMIKALASYDSSEILETLPEIPQQLASLSLKAQTEMRHCIQLLHDLKNPKKPSQFIKSYVHNQLNQLQTEQQELREQLEATKYAKVDTRSKSEAIADDPELEAVEYVNRTSDG